MNPEIFNIGDMTVVLTEQQIISYRIKDGKPYDVKSSVREKPLNAGTIHINVGENVIKGGSISTDKIIANAITSAKIRGTAASVKPSLFGQWIAKTKKLQEEWYGKDFENFTEQERVEWVRINVLAATDELHEALAEISWKPWASASFFNRDAFLGEIVDVLHFIGNLLAGAGITDAELNKAYDDKMQRNIKRQREGYSGTDKCVKCGRAADDVRAHGGVVKMWHKDATYDGISTNYDSADKYGCDSCFGNGDGFK